MRTKDQLFLQHVVSSCEMKIMRGIEENFSSLSSAATISYTPELEQCVMGLCILTWTAIDMDDLCFSP